MDYQPGFSLVWHQSQGLWISVQLFLVMLCRSCFLFLHFAFLLFFFFSCFFLSFFLSFFQNFNWGALYRYFVGSWANLLTKWFHFFRLPPLTVGLFQKDWMVCKTSVQERIILFWNQFLFKGFVLDTLHRMDTNTCSILEKNDWKQCLAVIQSGFYLCNTVSVEDAHAFSLLFLH